MNGRTNKIPNSVLISDLRSPLLVISALFLTAAVAFSLPGIIALWDREHSEYVLAILALDYVDSAICHTWLNVWRLIQILILVLPLPTAVGLWLCVVDARCKDEDRPMPPLSVRYFSRMVTVVRVVLWVVSLILAAVFLFRFIRYIVVNAPTLGGILFILLMLLLEGIFGAVTAVFLVIVIRCMNGVVEMMDTIRYNMTLGTCESYGLGAAPSALLILLGVAAIALCVIARGYIFPMLSCICFAAGQFLLACWIHGYRRRNGNRAIETIRSKK